jgi:peptide subunit release factor 1 (eRF1)
MNALTPDDVQVLLDRPHGQGMIVSCYADTSVTDADHWRWSRRLKNEAQAILRGLKNDVQARERFARDREVIQQTLAALPVPRPRGMAVFSAAERGFFRALPLERPVRDRLVLDEAPYLVPLLEALHRQRRYLLVLTDSHRGGLYEAAWGHAHLLLQVEEAVPRRQKSAGERWGKQQATIARHREDHLLHYRKALLKAIGQTWDDAPFRGLILLGDHETVDAVYTGLPPALASRVVHSARFTWPRRGSQLERQVRAVIDRALRAHDAGLIEAFERRMRERHLVAAGPQEVIDALRNGQVGYRGHLLLEPDRGTKATRCTRCDSLFTTLPATCPFCKGPCEQVNLWQELLLFAARHGITAHTVESNRTLARHGGVAAVLSRREPWGEAPPAPTEVVTATVLRESAAVSSGRPPSEARRTALWLAAARQKAE